MQHLREEDLKPCPFCGGEAEILDDLMPYVACTECEVSFISNHGYDGDTEYAAELWNARVNENDEQ
ncbi:hypothetical protein CTH30272_04103 [Allocatenococcus thiocycli]|nr:hypothetical protein CTH30272_04103 [Catenococcus thiocycli]